MQDPTLTGTTGSANVEVAVPSNSLEREPCAASRTDDVGSELVKPHLRHTLTLSLGTVGDDRELSILFGCAAHCASSNSWSQPMRTKRA